MKKQNSESVAIAARISKENFEMVKVMKKKYFINISALVRCAIEQKYKELESENDHQ